MKIIAKFIVLILFFSCSNKQNTLKQFANYPVKFDKQKINLPNNDFSVFIPKDFEWKVEHYDSENIILGIDAASKPDKDGFVDIISIQKIKSFGNKKDLKSEYEFCLDLIKNKVQKAQIIAAGKTDLLKQKAYFVHTKSDTETYGELELITLILDGGAEGVFYNLIAGASQTEDLKKNMSILIQSLMTFEKLNNE